MRALRGPGRKFCSFVLSGSNPAQPVLPSLTDTIGTQRLPVSGTEGKGPTRRGFLFSFLLDSSRIPRRPGGILQLSIPSGFTPVQPILTDIIGTHGLPVSSAKGKGRPRRGILRFTSHTLTGVLRHPGGAPEIFSPPGFTRDGRRAQQHPVCALRSPAVRQMICSPSVHSISSVGSRVIRSGRNTRWPGSCSSSLS